MKYNGKNFKRVINESNKVKDIGLFLGVESFTDEYFIKNPDAFCGVSLINTIFDCCSFQNMKFSNTDFNACVMMNTTFMRCKFSECWFGNVKFIDCTFIECCFEDSKNKRKECFVDCGFLNIKEDSEDDNQKIYNLYPPACPSTGSFIGWKAAYYGVFRHNKCIVKLYIPSSAKRSSAFGRKCRCSKAKVLGFYDLDGKKLDDNIDVVSMYDHSFIYSVGKYVVPYRKFNDNRFEECASGIHFFITREEAKRFAEGMMI